MARLILPADAARDEWLAERKHGVTATDVPILMGLSPWSSPFTLYHRKRGDLPDDPDSDVMRIGRELEPYIIRRFAEAHPEFHLGFGGLYGADEEPWRMATPDMRILEDTDKLVLDEGEELALLACLEAKSVPSWDDWGEEGTSDIPLHYKAQGLWQADVLQVPETRFAVLNRATGEYREYTVPHDEGEVAVLRKEALAFLERIDRGDSPPIDGSNATTDTLKALHPDLEDTEVEIGTQLAQRYRSAAAKAKHYEARKKFYENQIRDRLGNGRRVLHQGEKVASRAVFERTSLDSKRLKAEQPDLYSEYAVTTTVNRITPAQEKQ